MKVTRSISAYLLVLALVWVTSWATDAVEQIFDLSIAHGRVAEKEVIRVKQGDRVKLRWTTDEPMTLHLHGYDIKRIVKPGAVTELAFEAYATGRFPINVHGSGEHAHDESALVYLEVYPR